MKHSNRYAIVILMSMVVTSISACGNNATAAADNKQPEFVEETQGSSEVDLIVDDGATVYSEDSGNEHAIEADGDVASYDYIAVNKTGDGNSEDADFYGDNAAVFATNGAELNISNAKITSDGAYANAVFSYGENTVINISDSSISTSQRNSGGIMVTGGGTLNAENLTVETQGGSSAAIRSDRGGGLINVEGGSYTANGSGSPAIYSTADIRVSNAKLQSGSAQAVVVEGESQVTLNNCDVTADNTVQNSDKSDYYQAVMLYQTMSGDSNFGDGTFSMTDGSLTNLNGGMFFVTNATYAINLKNVTMTNASDELLRIYKAGWGNEGSNGGQVTLNADSQTLEGNIIVDDISKLNMYLDNNSVFTGTIDNEGEVYVEITGDSKWVLTGDCSITSLTCDADSIDLNGYKLTVGGKECAEGTESKGEAVEFVANDSPDMGKGEKPEGDMPEGDRPGDQFGGPGEGGDTPPAKPDGEDGNPPQKPDGEMPPEKP